MRARRGQVGNTMRTLIIHNLRSGFGSDAIFEFERSLVSEGDECVLRTPSADFSAPDVLADAEDFDLVVISGGDGTEANLLYELRDRDVLTCVFPSGTANLLFENIGNAAEPAALAHACRAGRFARTDLGEIGWTDESGEHHVHGFTIMAGTGFDAELMRSAAPNKQLMGEAAYFFAALSNLDPTYSHFTITVDGTTHECDGIACILANNAMIQGEVEIIPDCSMADGLIDVMVLETPYVVGLARTALSALLDPKGKKLGRPQIRTFQGREIHVESSEPVPIQVDGEPFPGAVRSYDARVLAGATKVVVDQLSRYAELAQEGGAEA